MSDRVRPYVYLIGSLRNTAIPMLGRQLREIGFNVFDDWYGAGKTADESWQAYENTRGRSYAHALYGDAADTIFNFDKTHLDRADASVLVLPAGKSGHMEFGYMLGRGKPSYVLFDTEEPERWDLMYRLATGVCFTRGQLFDKLRMRMTV